MNLSAKTWSYPEDVTLIKRTELLKYLLTMNPKAKQEDTIRENIGIIKEKYPIVQEAGEMFHEFHSIIMGDVPEKLDEYLHKRIVYGRSRLVNFAPKCFLAFRSKDSSLNLFDLIQIGC